MARSAEETASILINLYDESFSGESYKPFRIGWPELRSVAAVGRLSDEYLWAIDQTLRESGYFLFPLDNFLLVALESDLSHLRAVPPRIIEECLPDDDEGEYDEDDLELLEFGDDDLFAEAEAVETLLNTLSAAGEPPPATTAAPKGRRPRKSKDSDTPGEMSE